MLAVCYLAKPITNTFEIFYLHASRIAGQNINVILNLHSSAHFETLFPLVSRSGHRDFHGGVSHAFLSGLAQPSSIAGPHEKRSRNYCIWWVLQLQNKWICLEEHRGCMWVALRFSLNLNIHSCNADVRFRVFKLAAEMLLWVPRRYLQSKPKMLMCFFFSPFSPTSFQESGDIGLQGKLQAKEENGKYSICYTFPWQFVWF